MSVVRRFIVRLGSATSRVPRDLAQAIRWGPRAPRRGEIIDVDPSAVNGYLTVAMARQASPSSVRGGRFGYIVGGDWDTLVPVADITATDVYVSCRMRWIDERRWEDTPVFQQYVERMQRGEMPRFRSERALLERYVALDDVFEHVRRTRTLSERSEHLVLVSVGRDGRLIYGPDGRHRLVIALIAELAAMPARVGIVHRAGVDHFQALRRV